VLVNTEPRPNPLPLGLDPLPPSAGAGFGQPETLEGVCEPAAALAASEVRVVRLRRSTHVSAPMEITAGKAARMLPRIAIESITPAVDGGRFPAKRVVGETIAIEADVFTDGHEVLAVELLWKAADEKDWRAQRMQFASNDRWRTDITPDRIGRYVFTIEAWWDEYATFCRDLEIKRKAGADVALEIAEGRALLTRMQARARGAAAAVLRDAVGALTDADVGASIDILLGAGLREAVAACSPRHFRCRRRPVLAIEVERPQARFASWYELFPRSATNDPSRHGTFADVVAQLPQIRDMGFDVLYFPPIHPIGRVNRKGRNNNLHAQPGDLGSPYAIGSREGGHDAIHPCLGTIEDFRRLRDAAAEHGLEIALDFAIQCAPDHPWLTAHPGWFRWRPDGSIRFAENPPKKYEDIVNVDFYADGAIPDLWVALRDVVLYWIGEGVRTFRVDNPHTKPLPFWEWLIADVRSHHPDVIFLSEAFTRPKMMYRLAKTGFSQSYTYFTWRNTKQELTDYLVELTTTDVKDYFRPHFFVNTPDINPYFLQTSGRPGFLIRAALAATLSGLWGMYSGFELCESAPLPGREEYLDSEKYEIRVRDRSAPGNITSEIAKLNRIRRTNPALQTHLNLRFYNAFNDQVLYFGKAEPGARDMVLAAISLDPHRVQDAAIEVPLWHWGLPDSGSIAVEDLVRDHSFVWSGKLQRVVLDPAELPYAIWRLSPLPGA
jgi:starch synthase (maltosyl-transferring)